MAQVSRYHPLLVALHWVLAFLIIAALALGALVMVKIPNSDPMKLEALRSHVAGGVLILLLMLVRLFVRVQTEHPSAASTGNPTLDRLAWASHRLFYVAVMGLAGSGVFMVLQADLLAIVFGGDGVLPADFWAFPVRTVHYLFSWLLMAPPLHAAASSAITIEPAIGYTNTRAGFGGLPLGFAAILVSLCSHREDSWRRWPRSPSSRP